jgi:hypothetical protein
MHHVRKCSFSLNSHTAKKQYPPVPLNNREAVRTTILPTGGGPEGDKPMLVRKVFFLEFTYCEKTTISPFLTNMGLSPSGPPPVGRIVYGHDAYEFRPERWESGELANIGWGFFPFSGGPRQCLTSVSCCFSLPTGSFGSPTGKEMCENACSILTVVRIPS